MVDVQNYIVDLLYSHDCVIVPDLGAFLVHQEGAELHPVTHRFLPPSRKVAFNEQLRASDGILINAISVKESVSHSEAADLVGAYVRSFKEHLSKFSYSEIKDLGRFFYNVENKLEFEPDHKINFMEDSFGLSEFTFKPVERDNMNRISRPPQKLARKAAEPKEEADDQGQVTRKGSYTAIWAMLPLCVMLGMGAFLYLKKDDPEFKNSFPMAFIFPSSTDVASNAQPVDVVEEESDTFKEDDYYATSESEVAQPLDNDLPSYDNYEVVVDQPVVDQVAISGNRGNFSIIVGAFIEQDNALRMKNNIENNGQNALIFEPNARSRFYLVSVAEFNESKAAVRSIDQYRSLYGNEIWIAKK